MIFLSVNVITRTENRKWVMGHCVFSALILPFLAVWLKESWTSRLYLANRTNNLFKFSRNNCFEGQTAQRSDDEKTFHNSTNSQVFFSFVFVTIRWHDGFLLVSLPHTGQQLLMSPGHNARDVRLRFPDWTTKFTHNCTSLSRHQLCVNSGFSPSHSGPFHFLLSKLLRLLLLHMTGCWIRHLDSANGHSPSKSAMPF